MPLLSVVIITFNEERNIARCLESVRDIADDIVVLDSGSTDHTEDICKKFGVRFFQQAWKGYSEQKNFGNSLAANDWIFSIDADEALSEDLKKSILEMKQFPAVRNYRICRITNYCGKWIRHGGWYPDIKVRFFDRRNTRWEGMVHERLNIARDGDTALLKGDCYHYSYYTIEEHISQADRFSTLAAQDLIEQGKKVSGFKAALAPGFRFFKMFFLQLGFLDGKAGRSIARISASAVRLKYNKLKKLYAQRPA
jgi:glycosyltransferase involved in cell wall biosynthesis